MFKPNREFQAGLNSDETRRRRQNNSLSLRRKDREAKLQKKRQRILERNGRSNGRNSNSNSPNNNNNNNNNNNTVYDENHGRVTTQMIPLFARGVMSQQIAAQYESVKKLRELLSTPDRPPIKEVIDVGVVPRFIQLSRDHQYPNLQYECLWALLNIASGPAECCAQVIRSNAHNLFIDLLKSSKLYEIKEQAMWALGNIAGDGQELKDLLLNNGILSNILFVSNLAYDEDCVTNYNKQQHVSNLPFISFLTLLSTTSWAISNLCRTSPPPKAEQLELIIQCMNAVMVKAINYRQNKSKLFQSGSGHFDNVKIEEELDDIISNIAWAASYLSGYDYAKFVNYDGLKYSIERMASFGLIHYFVSFMDYHNSGVRHACSRVIGNIVTGSDDVTKKCLKLGILEKYKNTLTRYQSISPTKHNNKNNAMVRERKEICWAISNITAGPIEDKLEVEKQGLFEILCQLLKYSSFDVGKEALWALSNASTDTDKRIISNLVEKYGLIESLCLFLKRMPRNQTRILHIAFECIENILITGQQHQCQDEPNQYALKFEEDGMVRFLEDLQAEEQLPEECYEKAVDIITKYFDGHDENEDTLQQTTLDYGLDENGNYDVNQDMQNSFYRTNTNGNGNHNNNNSNNNNNNNNNNMGYEF